MLAKPVNTLPITADPAAAVPAAVLLLLFEIQSHTHFFLTERTNLVETHKGQISLPGGSQDPGEDLREAACRETWEEIGIPADEITIIGRLTELFVPITGFLIHPFVGVTRRQAAGETARHEVRQVFTPPVSDLLRSANHRLERWTIRGHAVDVPFFQLENCRVWGATAMILAEFTALMNEQGHE